MVLQTFSSAGKNESENASNNLSGGDDLRALVNSAIVEIPTRTEVYDMLKKVVIAVVAVGLSLLAVNFVAPKAISYLCLMVHEAQQSAQDAIPPEQEISRLKMELENLSKEDERHFHKVATQIVEVQNLEKQVNGMKEKLDKEEAVIKARRSVALENKDKFITYEGSKYDRSRFQDELRVAAARFQVDEQLYKSKDEQLSLRKKNLEMNRKKLAELKLVRQQMKTELERLETALAQERQNQAMEANTLDDASYQKLRKDVDSVRDKMEVLKQKRVLKGEVDGPVRADEQRKEQEAAIDRFLNERFSDKQ
jgi:hypothetical protein